MEMLNDMFTDEIMAEEVVCTERPHIYRIPDLHSNPIFNELNQYLLIKGGRGGFKTTSFICALIEYSYVYKSCAFLFTREIAKSIDDSVYSVVVDLIAQAGIGDDFDIQKKSITNRKTGVKMLFTGLRSTGGKTAMSQINKIKGVHKIRMIFMEEGQDLSEDSLNVLLPTANRKGIVKLVNTLMEAEETKDARFFVAMNPNKEIDPVVAKFKPYVEAGVGLILHINMMDIVRNQPEFADQQLINQMELEVDEYYFGHVWEGLPFHKFAGLPLSKHKVGSFSNIKCYYAFIDPSFKGGDYTSVCFLGEANGKAIAWGSAFKQAWNMSPCIDDVVALIRKYGPDKTWYEDNSLGTVPRTEYGRHGINVLAHTTVINKEDKIYKVAAYTKNIVWFASNLSNTIWLTQVQDYSDEAEHDDAPDSYASVVIKSGILKDKVKF